MNIEVFSHENPNDCRIYKDVIVYNIDGKNEFRVFDGANLSERDFSYKDYSWRESTPDEAMSYGIYTKENENLKYKLAVDDSGYGMNCTNCERIIFIKPKAGDSVELDSKKLSELDWININGIKFRREK